MNDIPEDYTHAELWMKYKSYQRKIERVETVVDKIWATPQSHLLADELNEIHRILSSKQTIIESEAEET